MTWEVRQGHVLDVLPAMPEASVACVVTSPPYWGLRDYGTATWEDGDADCKHAGRPKPRQDTSGTTKRFAKTRGTQPAKAIHSIPVRAVCRCGAVCIDDQIGLEATPDAYVARMVEVFREVRRVLCADGSVWLNMGDCFVSNPPGNARPDHSGPRLSGSRGEQGSTRSRLVRSGRDFGALLKTKDLVGMPWRVAFALQADGWWLRSDIVWAKPNPMPESVTDRPTRAHEYLFLLAKNERYHYDAQAIAEPVSGGTHSRGGDNTPRGWDMGPGSHRSLVGRYGSGNKARKVATAGERARTNTHLGSSVPWEDVSGVRNRRSVWTITTQPFPGAHFATFPEALVEPCVLAGSRPGELVLDPFAGSGTVGVVALRHGRRFLGVDLSLAYCEMARRRIAGPLFAEATP